jgi:hypothetical protein
MEGPHPLFRSVPPWTLVLDLLKMLGLSTEPPFTFTRNDVQLEQSEEAATLLAPFYKPCKARQFLEYTDQNRWITILRHVLHPHGYCLTVKETTRDKKKCMMYTIERSNGELKTAVKVDFS